MHTRAIGLGGTLAAFVWMSVFVPIPAAADPGTLDTSFFENGMVLTAFSSETDVVRALTLQPDGKIVAAGYSKPLGVALARYNPDGTLDETFGIGGRVTTDVGPTFGAFGIGRQSTGRLVVAAPAGGNFTVLGYTSTGALDASFGTGGSAAADFFGGADDPFALVVQPDDRILVAGSATSSLATDIAVARFLADGSLDLSFGDGGRVATNLAEHEGAGSSDVGHALALQPDGKILVAGRLASGFIEEGETDPTIVGDFALVRYNADGTLDDGFGDGGVLTTDVANDIDTARAVARQLDGKIVVAGDSRNGGSHRFTLVRYGSDGALDTSFGSAGIVTHDLPAFSETADALVIDVDGRIIAAGIGSTNFMIARYTSGGALDTTFGVEGVVSLDFAESTDDANALVLQPDGKLIVAGSSRVGSNDDDFALARLVMSSLTTSVPPFVSREAVLRAAPNPSAGVVMFSLESARTETPGVATVVDVRGRLVRSWTLPAGNTHRWVWDGRDARGAPVAPGVYVANVETGGRGSASRKVLIAR